ncbi:hypothetical protein Cantr_07295 [Candida viswanathii]|uniref:Uncharacterized protein n=1 Tax=Candida viswanathii TaxID=5486 RepID=A0A367Y1I5_9ASCO|nr:hypothetical protein Cantr_07295 [Candida viswanathii]
MAYFSRQHFTSQIEFNSQPTCPTIVDFSVRSVIPTNADASLQNLNNSQLKLLVNTRKNKLFEKANSQIVEDLNPQEYIPQDRLEIQSIDEERDFRMSNRIKTLSTIFSILSNNQDINHPLSEDCANLLIENYKLKFDQSQKEKDSYLSFLKNSKTRTAS